MMVRIHGTRRETNRKAPRRLSDVSASGRRQKMVAEHPSGKAEVVKMQGRVTDVDKMPR